MATTPNPDLPDIDEITTKGAYSVFFSEEYQEVNQEIADMQAKRQEALETAKRHENQAQTLREQLGKNTVQQELGGDAPTEDPEKIREKIREHEAAAQEARGMADALTESEETYERKMQVAEEVAQEYEQALHSELDELVESFAEHAQALVTLNKRIRERIQEISSSNENQRVQRESSRDRRGEITSYFKQKPPYMPSLLPKKVGLRRLKAALSEQGYSIEV